MTILSSIPLTTIKRIASPLALTISTQTGGWILRRKTRKIQNTKFKQIQKYEVSHLYENQIRNLYRFLILIPRHLLPQLTPQWHSLQMQELLIPPLLIAPLRQVCQLMNPLKVETAKAFDMVSPMLKELANEDRR